MSRNPQKVQLIQAIKTVILNPENLSIKTQQNSKQAVQCKGKQENNKFSWNER